MLPCTRKNVVLYCVVTHSCGGSHERSLSLLSLWTEASLGPLKQMSPLKTPGRWGGVGAVTPKRRQLKGLRCEGSWISAPPFCWRFKPFLPLQLALLFTDLKQQTFLLWVGPRLGSIGLVFQDHTLCPCFCYYLTELRAVAFSLGKTNLLWGLPWSSEAGGCLTTQLSLNWFPTDDGRGWIIHFMLFSYCIHLIHFYT